MQVSASQHKMNEKMLKASVAQLELQRRALDFGFIVSLPSVEGMRYDCILDTGNKLFRVQVKYAGYSPDRIKGCVHLRLDKPPGRGIQKPYGSEIDLLCVYLPVTGKIYVFDHDVFGGKTSLQIRFEATLNNQNKGCLMAEKHVWECWAKFNASVTQLAECHLAKMDVDGSNPFTRSISGQCSSVGRAAKS